MVDDHDRVVGTADRLSVRRRNLLHRAVYVVVLSSDGEVLVHRRSDAKDVWPGHWDLAVGGVVAAGEGYDEAAAREVAEEIGVVVTPRPLGHGRYDGPEVRCLGRVYVVRHDGPFRFADGEVVEARFVSLDELAARVARDPFCPDSLALVLTELPGLGTG